ncbi:hypothetical protein BL250_12000 [Erwinia sp. OLTSP20]|uniref:SrfA family protein n=1 Tax=unclassified Erwinia TaxID=2622719 RepID=UPI000C6B058C|nr:MULTISPECIES: SrfA family protein [unclassified Erwinia]PIJ49530.1 hypothetical protein BV501_12490 [Erwinia sp. OAMSP11]PIJ71196.1 hypothetical protein BK416_11970 [Erwinia sp. OLSSP12]PIJ79845.1 hypothetical protein BLD47_12740 [Erwinia sp. OLCASP19]PIJ81608.1 hypothetical protein BLD46_12585 [Erwinia sp. OLMTSP26]PIJ84023.1 hypothetical protein BLD49_12680 [Erwinia sp. OLMDSP33]
MANTFLRSGNLDSVLALGENGQPVWYSARQILETLRLRQKQALADLFALPQPDEAGSRLDWYAQFEGNVVSWNNASSHSRSQAISQLEQCAQALQEISHVARAAGKPGHQLFANLLAKALHFPDQNCVFLVADKPVITFWGFSALNKRLTDPLDLLRHSVQESMPPLITPVATVTPATHSMSSCGQTSQTNPDNLPFSPQASIRQQQQLSAMYQCSLPADNMTEPEPEPGSQQSVALQGHSRPHRWRYGWILPAIALLALAGLQLRSYFSAEKSPVLSQARPAAKKTPLPRLPVLDPHNQATHSSPIAIQLPLAHASLVPPATPHPLTETAADTGQTQPKNVLVLPATAVRRGSTQFLNGSWQVVPGVNIPVTGRWPLLRYQFSNGKGTATLLQGGNIRCRIDVFAGLMKSGKLVIKARSRAKCSDGRHLAMPEVSCTQPETRAALCSARFDDNTAYPVTMQRAGR